MDGLNEIFSISQLIRDVLPRTKSRKMERFLISDRFACSNQIFTGGLLRAQRQQLRQLISLLTTKQLNVESQACPCGQVSRDIVIADREHFGLPFTSLLCDACGTVRLDPYLDAASHEFFAREILPDLAALSTSREPEYRKQVAFGKDLHQSLFKGEAGKGRRVLEIGCGTGGALAPLAKAGFLVMGCDDNRTQIEYGTARGVGPLLETSKLAASAPTSGFDCVIVSEKLSNVNRLIDQMQMAKRFVKPDGFVVCTTSDISALDATGRSLDLLNWIHVGQRYYFSAIGAQAVAKSLGYATEQIKPGNMSSELAEVPENWFVLRPSRGQATSLKLQTSHGKEILRRLTNIEDRYLSRRAAA